MSIDKNKIYEIAFKTIEESVEWGLGNKDGTYADWVDGVITLARNLINKLDGAANENDENSEDVAEEIRV